MVNIYEAQRANKIKSSVIVVAFFVFVAGAVYILVRATSVYVGYEFGGLGFVGIALIVSGISSFVGYYYSDRIILSISKAREADRKKDFNFYTVGENLAIGAGIKKPRLFVIEDSAPNAFATGRDPDHAVVCATTGLLDKLTRSELEGVIAHELTHIKNYDIRLMSVVSVLVGMIALLGDWFLRISFRGRKSDSGKGQMGAVLLVLGLIFAVLSPIIAQLIQLAVSRRREFLADAGSVSITKQPQGLITALEKISSDSEPLEVANKATAHLFIVSPFKGNIKGTVGRFANFFNTHPPVSERIRNLQSMV